MTTAPQEVAPVSFFGRMLELLSDSAVYGLSTLLTQVVGFLLLPLYTQHLHPSDYGVLAMLTVVTMAFTPIATVCIPNAAYRSFNLQNDETERGVLITTAAIAVAVASCATLLLGVLASAWLAEIFIGDRAAAPLVSLTMLTAAVTSVGEIARVELRSRRRVRVVGALNLATFVVIAGLTIYWVVYDGLGVDGVVRAGLAGAVFATLSAFLLIRGRLRFRFDRQEFRRLLDYGAPLVPHKLFATVIMTYSQFGVRTLLGLEEAGLFDMATRFALPLGLIVNAVQEAWVPYKFQVHATDERPQDFFRRSFTYYLALVLFLWVGLAAWGPEVLRWMTDPRFHAAASLVALAALMRVGWGVYTMMGSGIELSSNTRPYSLISLAGLIVVVGASTLLIPRCGAGGAAVATSLAYFAMAYMARRLARTRIDIPYDWPRVAALGGAAAVCVAATYLAASLPTAPRLSVACALPAAYAVVAFRILRKGDSQAVGPLASWPVEAGS